MEERFRRRRRVLGFVALSVACVGVSVGYVVHAGTRRVPVSSQAGAVPGSPAPPSFAPEGQPHVVFRNLSEAARAGFAALDSDVYAVPADGSGAPRPFLGRADSPAVVATAPA